MERYYKRKAHDMIDANRISYPDEINWDEEIKYEIVECFANEILQ